MKATSTWTKGFQSILDDGRGHKVTVDLPKESKGEDTGTSALELTNMTLAGCITTIFALVAGKMRLSFSSIKVDVESVKSKETGTIGTSKIVAVVSSDGDHSKIEKCFNITMQTCPVGLLFEKAGVEIQSTLKINS